MYLEAKLRPSKWTDKSGQDRISTDIVLTGIELVGKASQRQGVSEQNGHTDPKVAS